jgi:hypothetical protein
VEERARERAGEGRQERVAAIGEDKPHRDWRLLARVSFVGFLFYITAVKKERLRFIEGKMNG